MRRKSGRNIMQDSTLKIQNSRREISLAQPLSDGMMRGRKQNGFYAKMSDDEIIAYTQMVMREKGISTRKKLKKADAGLYDALHRRQRNTPEIMGKIGFERKIREERNWEAMGDEELVAYVKAFMKEKGITGRSELRKADWGLFFTLKKREKKSSGLMQSIGFGGRRRDWNSMGDEEFVAHIQAFMNEKGITSRKELQNCDSGMYCALLRRDKKNSGIFERVGFEANFREWDSMGDEELVAHAKRFMEKKGISTRWELQKADLGLYSALLRRDKKSHGIMESIGFEVRLRDWNSMGDIIVAHVKAFMKEKGISTKSELENADRGLYEKLRRLEKKSPGLMESVGFERKIREERNWEAMGDEELVAYVKAFMKEKGITGRTELREADAGLFFTLKKREKKSPRIMEIIGFGERLRDWNSMEDEGLVAHIKEFMKEKGITGRTELRKADNGLYSALLKREKKSPGIMNRIGFERKKRKDRNWNSIGDKELVAHAKIFIEEMNILGNRELKKADSGLYTALRKRKLLHAVFENIKNKKEDQILSQLKDAVELYLGKGEER